MACDFIVHDFWPPRSSRFNEQKMPSTQIRSSTSDLLLRHLFQTIFFYLCSFFFFLKIIRKKLKRWKWTFSQYLGVKSTIVLSDTFGPDTPVVKTDINILTSAITKAWYITYYRLIFNLSFVWFTICEARPRLSYEVNGEGSWVATVICCQKKPTNGVLAWIKIERVTGWVTTTFPTGCLRLSPMDLDSSLRGCNLRILYCKYQLLLKSQNSCYFFVSSNYC